MKNFMLADVPKLRAHPEKHEGKKDDLRPGRSSGLDDFPFGTAMTNHHVTYQSGGRPRDIPISLTHTSQVRFLLFFNFDCDLKYPLGFWCELSSNPCRVTPGSIAILLVSHRRYLSSLPHHSR